MIRCNGGIESKTYEEMQRMHPYLRKDREFGHEMALLASGYVFMEIKATEPLPDRQLVWGEVFEEVEEEVEVDLITHLLEPRAEGAEEAKEERKPG